ncbi:hypothetical protein [Arthrobacter crystallopoietes]|uniref:Uncharacterized protein n=1 Tax=Crystallibacter crystallopoietes TaxID=37928 RepID=A0A1H1APM0_9MICC|nr:hypothetical protein [Arthrobacter crystallopoietes]AUI51463.1 hypothetical protein AC20117_12275 [Arthrobacter crystallopoietes]SDQ41116.1 hypothetical protein SAMN04489742_1010 [Arthrobacter crystallopoietes]
MRRPLAVVVTVLVCLGVLGAVSAAAFAFSSGEGESGRTLVISNDDGELARVPLAADSFAVSYRNSIYHSRAEERYKVQPDGTYRLMEIAADQLAVLEEYYGVPGAPASAAPGDRRNYVVPPDPSRPVVFDTLSIAATDLGQRTLHVPEQPPLALWELVGNDNPYVVLDIKENP